MKLVSKIIEDKVKLLEAGRERLKDDAYKKAEQLAFYERELAKTIIQLKNGKEMELDGEKIQNPPASFTEKIARGICWQEKLNADLADTTYRSTVVKMQMIQSELNAYQSLYKSQIEV